MIENLPKINRKSTFDSLQEVQSEIVGFKHQLNEIDPVISANSSLELMQCLKRDIIKKGPYPHVTLLESANRILTDCVIYNTLLLIFENKIEALPSFKRVEVDFGHSNKQKHDIIGFDVDDNPVFYAEAFNTAPTFFMTKLFKTRSKLKNTENQDVMKLICFNRDACKGYRPKNSELRYIVVDTLI
ncbi:hypothetical protein [uncultured Fluviicola sp.]|uniref:hypothetical protein n=1 Tax=uncultured Fluviicola sp. TaxID=463303 RepID=UPI0025DA6119|nr:hypothetical protein [uncultured Fluviicola sp.]